MKNFPFLLNALQRSVLCFMLLTSAFAIGFTSCSEDDLDVDDNNGENTSTSIKPPMEGEGLKLVGNWYGYGPYVASGTSYSKYGLVNGIWEFYNDGTYSWEGHNSFGYKYSEKGKWHYNSEKQMLITDSPCGLNWKIEEVSKEQWVGTLLGAKEGTYTYTRNNINVKPGDIYILDYKKGGFILKDTLVNYSYCIENVKCGVCYGMKGNNDISTFKKVYADKIYTDTVFDWMGNIMEMHRGLYNVEITSMQENEKYQLCNFVEYDNGETVYGNIYKAISVTPPQNTVYLGDASPAPAKAIFWTTTGFIKDKNGIDKSFSYDEASEYLSQLGKGWELPNMNKIQQSLLSNAKAIKNEEGKLDYIQIKSKINGNELYFKFFWMHSIIPGYVDGYLCTNDFWSSDIENTEHCNIALYNDVKESYTEAGKIGAYYDNLPVSHLLPIFIATVKW